MVDELPKVRRTIYSMYIKRLLDIIISGIAIIVLSPLFIVLTFLELIIHGSPVLYAQDRLGFQGKIFRLYKFRSMTNEMDSDGKLLPSEKRLTHFGKILRRFSIDELPELFCVLIGKMSIIGPRPLIARYLPLYSKRHMMRHEVKPGFACVPLKAIATWSWNDQFENDIWYVENCSFLVDLKMTIAVIREAIVGSKYRVDDTREEYNGFNLFSDAKETQE